MWRLMYPSALSKGVGLNLFPRTHCDGDEASIANSESTPSLLEQADAAAKSDRFRIKTPMQLESLKYSFSSGRVSTFDGLRFAVSKQVNLNTVVSHFYWIGSQQAPGIYQYRIILPFEDKVFNVASDAEANIEGEFKYTVSPRLALKSSFVVSGRENSLTLQAETTDESSALQVELAQAATQTLGLAYMQTVHPGISLGALGQLDLSKNALTTAWAAHLEDGISSLTLLYDKQLQVLYARRINPNRVHLYTDLVVGGETGSVASVSAEYILKQSKLHMSIDSNLLVKSMVETTVMPGVALQLCGEQLHAKDQYKIGVGIVMG